MCPLPADSRRPVGGRTRVTDGQTARRQTEAQSPGPGGRRCGGGGGVSPSSSAVSLTRPGLEGRPAEGSASSHLAWVASSRVTYAQDRVTSSCPGGGTPARREAVIRRSCARLLCAREVRRGRGRPWPRGALRGHPSPAGVRRKLLSCQPPPPHDASGFFSPWPFEAPLRSSIYNRGIRTTLDLPAQT